MIQALANHLWQSTLFAAAAGALALTLRNYGAAVRYRIWLAASMKFLVPFALLVLAGGEFGRQRAAQITPPAAIMIRSVGQPFAAAPPANRSLLPPRPAASPIPSILAVVWAAGFAGVLLSWARRFTRVRSLVSAAKTFPLDAPVPVLASRAILEPSVFGILRQKLLLPENIEHSLTPEQLRAVIAHELCHIRRRDNLTASFHMAVEALFWFHPLVWWLGTRLVEERELACDQEVLRQLKDPQTYAEALLQVCELYVESSLPCAAGVTGSHLRTRIERVMANRPPLRLTAVKKALVGAAASIAVVTPLILGVLNAPLRAQTDWQAAAGGNMAFEVASVKTSAPEAFTPPPFPLDAGNAFTPTGGRFTANFPLMSLINFAYKITPTPDQRAEMMAHLPGWVATDRFVVEARGPANSTKDQFRLMMQALLADRFKLKAHFESHEASVYALTLIKPGKPGPKLIPHSAGPPCPATAELPPGGAPSDKEAFPPVCEMYGFSRNADGSRARWGSRNVSMASIALMLPNVPFSGVDQTHPAVDRAVVDQTGLTGNFDFLVEFLPQPDFGVEPDPSGPTFLDGLREQLGLKLESAKGQTQVLVIDHIERLSEN